MAACTGCGPCGGQTVDCCSAGTVANNLTLSINIPTVIDCGCFDDETVTLVWDGTEQWWQGSLVRTCNGVLIAMTFRLECGKETGGTGGCSAIQADDWCFTVRCEGSPNSSQIIAGPVNCSPLNLNFNTNISPPECCNGTEDNEVFNITITE